MKERFWEIDFLRGLAIIKMLIFNYSFALYYLGIFVFEAGLMFQGWAAAVFVFLVGLSLTLSYSRVKDWSRGKIFFKFLKRGLMVFGWGLVITIITFILFPEAYIIFGVLHLIGVSIIMGQFFLKYRRLNFFLGLLIIFLGLYMQSFRVNFPWLLWLGFVPKSLYSFDYFPILPWFGYVLLGIFTGNTLYKNGKRTFKIKDLSSNIVIKPISFLGRKSLYIYLLHQPILILILLLLGFKLF